MRKHAKVFAMVMVFLMAVSVLGACGGGSTSTAGGGTSTAGGGGTTTQSAADPAEVTEWEDTVYVGYNADIITADPYMDGSANVKMFTFHTFRPLTFNNYATGELEMLVAESVTDISGGTQDLYEVKLRKGIKFHNGDELTAEDVEFTWNFAKEPSNVTAVIPNADVMVEKLEVIDDYTLHFHLKIPMVDFAGELEVKIYSKKAFDELPREEAGTIGCGPYMYGEHRIGIDFKLERFDDFYLGVEDFPSKTIHFKVMPEYDTTLTALESGDIDCSYSFTPAQVPVIEAAPNLVLHSIDSAQPWFIKYSFKQEHNNNLDFRKAIAYGVNRDDVVEIALNNGLGGTATYNFCPPPAFGYVEITGYEYDPDEARRLLEETGYMGLPITIICYAAGKPAAEVLQAQMAAIGLDPTVTEWAGAEFLSNKRTRATEWDISIEYSGYHGSMLSTFERYFTLGGALNYTDYQNDEFDAMLLKAKTASTYEDMAKEFAIMQQWVTDNCALTPVYVQKWNGACRDYVVGFTMPPNATFTNATTLGVPKGARG